MLEPESMMPSVGLGEIYFIATAANERTGTIKNMLAVATIVICFLYIKCRIVLKRKRAKTTN